MNESERALQKAKKGLRDLVDESVREVERASIGRYENDITTSIGAKAQNLSLEARAINYRDIYKASIAGAKDVIEKAKQEGTPFSTEIYPSKPFDASITLGNKENSVKVHFAYSGVPNEPKGRIRKFARFLMRTPEPQVLTMKSSIMKQGPDLDLDPLIIRMNPNANSRDHNIFEEVIAEYVLQTLKYASGFVSQAANGQKENGNGIPNLLLSGVSVGNLACEIADKSRNPSFLGTFENVLGREECEAKYQEALNVALARLEEVNKKAGDLEAELAREDAEIPKKLAGELQVRKESLVKKASELESRLTEYATTQTKRFDDSVIVEIEQRKREAESELDALNKEVQARKKYIGERKGRIDETVLYFLNEFRESFPDFSSSYASSKIDEVYRASCAKRCALELCGKEIKATHADFIYAVKLLRHHSIEGQSRVITRSEMDRIICTAFNLAKKLDSEGIKQVESTLRKMTCNESTMKISDIEEVFNNLLK